jgi:hypothetical protein
MGKNKAKRKLPKPEISSDAKLPSYGELAAGVNYLVCTPSFCFAFFDEKHSKYSARCQKDCTKFHLLFRHLKSLAQMNWGQIERSGNYHAHDVTWATTRERTGFPASLGDIPQRFPPYQFQPFDDVRIFGFHRGGSFYVVWIDWNHGVDP